MSPAKVKELREKSPSIRREWIEILQLYGILAVRKRSPSIRREWIEMLSRCRRRRCRCGLPPYGGSGLKCIMWIGGILL